MYYGVLANLTNEKLAPGSQTNDLSCETGSHVSLINPIIPIK
jgi:hypothetical protein